MKQPTIELTDHTPKYILVAILALTLATVAICTIVSAMVIDDLKLEERTSQGLAESQRINAATRQDRVNAIRSGLLLLLAAFTAIPLIAWLLVIDYGLKIVQKRADVLPLLHNVPILRTQIAAGRYQQLPEPEDTPIELLHFTQEDRISQ